MRSHISMVLLVLLVGCGSRPDYVATPFFSEAAFREVHTRMGENAVRAVLGYPASRFGPVEVPGNGSKMTWHYTVPASGEPPLQFHSFDVTFGPDGLVSSKLICEASWQESDGVKDSVEAVRQSRRRLGDVVLTRPDGSTNVLRASNPGLYVVLLDGDGTDGPRLNAGPAWLAEALPGLVKTGAVAGVLHFYVGQRSLGYGGLTRNLSAETARDCYLDADPELHRTVWDSTSGLLLYKAGEIWSVPAITTSNGHLAAEDQKWLVQRLGATSSTR